MLVSFTFFSFRLRSLLYYFVFTQFKSSCSINISWLTINCLMTLQTYDRPPPKILMIWIWSYDDRLPPPVVTWLHFGHSATGSHLQQPRSMTAIYVVFLRNQHLIPVSGKKMGLFNERNGVVLHTHSQLHQNLYWLMNMVGILRWKIICMGLIKALIFRIYASNEDIL